MEGHLNLSLSVFLTHYGRISWIFVRQGCYTFTTEHSPLRASFVIPGRLRVSRGYRTIVDVFYGY